MIEPLIHLRPWRYNHEILAECRYAEEIGALFFLFINGQMQETFFFFIVVSYN